MEQGITIALDDTEILSAICGANDSNLRVIENLLGGYITARGNEIHFGGNAPETERFSKVMNNLITAVKEGEGLSPEYIRALTGEITPDENGTIEETNEKGGAFLRDSAIQIPHGLRRVYPRSRNQALYIRGMREYEICFCVGPAGTGKTYLAIAHALQMLL